MPLTLTASTAAESLLAFWADAGVDVCLEYEPVDRTVRPAPRPATPGLAAPVVADTDAPSVATPELDVDSAQSLDELAAIAAQLRPVGATPAPWFRGAPAPAVLVIGDPPGADEVEGGQAFAGACGRLLDAMLAAAGLGERALALHASPWRPRGDGALSEAETQACRPLLSRALALTQPKCVLLLGDAALRTYTGRSEGVLALRGRWLEREGAPVLPSFSPGLLLKRPAAKAQAWSDLLTLLTRVDPIRNDP